MKILFGKPVPLPTQDEATACLLVGTLFKPRRPDAVIQKGVAVMQKLNKEKS